MSANVSLTVEARREQRDAADPSASVWVAASAGTGKTTVLTNRVLNLLFAGTPPTRILCLTFTKAAAAEVANRVAARLGEWATVTEEALAQALAELTGSTPKHAELERARRLFAQVVDAPGGLKIDTIHAFCQSLLRRFPLEAGISPHFQVMDERSAAELMDAARDEVLIEARHGANEMLAEALAEVTAHVSEQTFGELMQELAKARGRLDRMIAHDGGFEAEIAQIYRRLGLALGETAERVLARACDDDVFDAVGLRDAVVVLATGSKTDKERGATIAEWLAEPALRATCFEGYRGAYLTSEYDVRKTLATKGALKTNPRVGEVLLAEAERLLRVTERMKAAVTAAASAALLRLGAAILGVYRRHKEFQALLDYDDLILTTRRLLRMPGADWVLYKLDQGLDHILVDEAQDTSPDQWAVIAGLAEEFFTGAGAHENPRTVFVVGDAKQSIYSFQGADPAAFERMRGHFSARVKAAGETWKPIPLEISFRSTAAVLRAVDRVFAQADAADGVIAAGQVLHHRAARDGHAGLVELWPLVSEREREPLAPWSPPTVRESFESPSARLAQLIASRIKRWCAGDEPLQSKSRAVRPGDVMVLVRRRNIFVEELVRALKSAGVPVAGVDRMVLADQLAVMDLMALARFLLLPEDDLTLATVLKSPLVGLDEDQLFALAYGREPYSLWQMLVRRANEAPEFAAAHAYLAGLLARVDFIPPFELFTEILGTRGQPDGKSGRTRILSRLGHEAEEPLDEFLAQALLYERGHVPSLEGFLHWVEAGEGEIKRDAEASARDEVRIMTVHGAKGLEAPIVILPDTAQVPVKGPRLLWDDGDDAGFLWPPRREYEESVSSARRAAADRRRDQEHRRLLYVAMTRAQDRLYVCGWHGRQGPRAGCWYNLIQAGLAGLAEPFAFDCAEEILDGWAGEGLRLTSPQTVPPELERGGPHFIAAEPLPEWAHRRPPEEPVPTRPLAPSRPTEEEAPVRSPLGPDQGYRFRRGTLIHRLLEALPELAPDARGPAARRYLARPAHGLSEVEQAEIIIETLAVLADSGFAALFGPGSRAEVPIVGVAGEEAVVISGQVDRLLVTADEVLVIDYKTNRPPPTTVGAVPPLYLKQMAAYRMLLRQVYPSRTVRCALLWTDGPRLMPLPDDLLNPWAP